MHEPRGPGRRYRILNVNDSVACRYLVTRMLEATGYEMIECANGLETLERVQGPQRPDLVILDVKLPDLDGFEVCRRIKDDPATADIKVLHTSATLVSASNRVQGLEVGADGYLTQPFEAEELRALVRSLLRLSDTERALRERAAQLLDADRRKDEFLAMLGHELRNPLSVLTTSLAILEPYLPRDAIEARARQLMARQLGHLSRMVEDLLDVARVTRGLIELRHERVDLGESVARAVETAEQIWTGPHEQRITLVRPPTPMPVMGDPSRLEQVITNLLHNASKFGSRGMEIEVALSTVEQADQSAWVVLTVRDHGAGIEPGALSAIFETFHQSNPDLARSRGGLGLGLALVKSLTELHGGRVAARSAGVGHGSVFEVWLPLAADPAAALHGARASAQQAKNQAPRRQRILVIDDNVDVLETVRALCTTWGHEVIVASDGITGVELASRSRPDVALVDIGLPGIDGYEVVRRIRQKPSGAHVRVVAITGYGSDEDKRRAAEAGFDIHLSKPVEPGLLRQVIDVASPLARTSP